MCMALNLVNKSQADKLSYADRLQIPSGDIFDEHVKPHM